MAKSPAFSLSGSNRPSNRTFELGQADPSSNLLKQNRGRGLKLRSPQLLEKMAPEREFIGPNLEARPSDYPATHFEITAFSAIAEAKNYSESMLLAEQKQLGSNLLRCVFNGL